MAALGCGPTERAGVPYAYGKAEYARTYEPQPMHPVIETTWRRAEELADCRFDVCFLNGYENEKDQLGWHADNSPEMDDLRPIAIVTFMEDSTQAREIWFKQQNLEPPGKGLAPADYPTENLKLASGSLALMAAGMQDTHMHRIPNASFKCAGRISLTFRGYVAPIKRGTITDEHGVTTEAPAPTDEFGKYIEERSRRVHGLFSTLDQEKKDGD